MAKVTVSEAVRDAVLVLIRLGLGLYRLEGKENVLVPESRVAWGTVVNEMSREGYLLVSREDYAAAYAVSSQEVEQRIALGEIFVIRYNREELLALHEREIPDALGPLPH